MNENETYASTTTPSTETILAEAQRRLQEKQSTPGEPQQPELTPQQRAWNLRMNRAVFWLSKHWLALANLWWGAYIALAFLAPVLAHYGYAQGATWVYRFYQPFCHQQPVRSWFLFGAQSHYTVESELIPPELQKDRDFYGNATLGYKVAFCERDVAIYGAMALGGLAYALARRFTKIPPLPLWAYVAFAIAPMGLDGGYQLLTQILALIKPGTFLPHETTPLLRSLTGALFGLGSIAVAYPYLNEFFEETRALLGARYQWR